MNRKVSIFGYPYSLAMKTLLTTVKNRTKSLALDGIGLFTALFLVVPTLAAIGVVAYLAALADEEKERKDAMNRTTPKSC